MPCNEFQCKMTETGDAFGNFLKNGGQFLWIGMTSLAGIQSDMKFLNPERSRLWNTVRYQRESCNSCLENNEDKEKCLGECRNYYYQLFDMIGRYGYPKRSLYHIFKSEHENFVSRTRCDDPVIKDYPRRRFSDYF